MSMKFFANIQDFLNFYTPAALNTVVSSPSEIAAPSSFYANADDSSASPSAPPPDGEAENKSPTTTVDAGLGDGVARRPEPSSADTGSSAVDAAPAPPPPPLSPRPGSSKRVRFPPPDELVSDVWRQPEPFPAHSAETVEQSVLNVHEILESYLNACKKLRIGHSSKVEKQISCFHMGKHERQEILSLRGEKITAAHLDCLEEVLKRVQFVNVEFEYCFLDDEAVVSLCDMLEFYDSAVRLNLSFNQNIGFRGWQALCRVLRKSPCLEQLNLRYTSLNERSAPILARTLRTNELSLTSLHLENCSLTGKSILLLACALKSNCSIRDLHLAENNLQAADAAHLYHIIVNNCSLELLDLRNNHIQDSGFAHICDGLKHPDCRSKSKLNTLVLWNNRITSHGMMHLVRVLLENKTLKTLNLGSNSICSEGVALIKESLARNQSLLRLGLQATKLANQGAIALAECIADNSALVRLDLRSNPDIKSAGLLALHVALRMNKTLTSLNLDESCAAPGGSASKSREHAEHFKKLYAEISQFCRRNYELYLQKLLGARTDGASRTGDERDSSASADPKAEPSDDGLPSTALEVVAQEKLNGSKLADSTVECSRKISLTCKETVDNVEERFATMPRLDEHPTSAPDEAPAGRSTADKSQEDADSSTKSSAVPGAAARSPRTSTAEAPSPAPRRFSVSKVTAAARPLPAPPAGHSSSSKQQSRSPSSSSPTADDDEGAAREAVSRLIDDVLNYCSYETGDSAPFRRATTVDEDDRSIDEAVAELMDDLLRYVEFEATGGASRSFGRAGSVRRPPVAGRSAGAAETAETALAVRETVRDLVKRVCVSRDRAKTIRKTAPSVRDQ